MENSLMIWRRIFKFFFSSKSGSTSIASSMASMFRISFSTMNTFFITRKMCPDSWFRPFFRHMMTCMFTYSHKLKILNSIVKFIMINMMDLFILFKFSTKMLFHYFAMFKKIFSTYCKFFIAILCYMTSSFFNSNVWKIFISILSKSCIMKIAKIFSSCSSRTIVSRTYSFWRNTRVIFPNTLNTAKFLLSANRFRTNITEFTNNIVYLVSTPYFFHSRYYYII